MHLRVASVTLCFVLRTSDEPTKDTSRTRALDLRCLPDGFERNRAWLNALRRRFVGDETGVVILISVIVAETVLKDVDFLCSTSN